MEPIGSLKSTLLAGTIVAASATASLAEFPERNIEIIHPWGPGNAMAMSQVVAKAIGGRTGHRYACNLNARGGRHQRTNDSYGKARGWLHHF